MAVVTGQRIERYNVDGGRCVCAMEIDGVTYKQTRRKVENTDPGRAAALARAEVSLVRQIEYLETEGAVNDALNSTGDWSSLPEPLKQRVAKRVARRMVRHARRAQELRQQPGMNPEAVQQIMCTRPLINNVWDEYVGNHASKAPYFGLEGPGPGTEYESVNAWVNDQRATINAELGIILSWLNTFTPPKEISTEE